MFYLFIYLFIFFNVFLFFLLCALPSFVLFGRDHVGSCEVFAAWRVLGTVATVVGLGQLGALHGRFGVRRFACYAGAVGDFLRASCG